MTYSDMMFINGMEFIEYLHNCTLLFLNGARLSFIGVSQITTHKTEMLSRYRNKIIATLLRVH